MRFLVTATALETIVTPEAVRRLREVFLKKVRQMSESGKLVEGGHIVARRAGYFLLDVDSAEELMDLLVPLHDFCRIEADVVESFEERGRALEATPVE
jgi:muconolactone delta-isomerase